MPGYPRKIRDHNPELELYPNLRSKKRVNERSNSGALRKNNKETKDKKKNEHWHHPPEFPLPEKT
jgi:hypothetical protein